MPGQFTKHGITFTIHFLVAGEGKGVVDAHFAVISKLMESWLKSGTGDQITGLRFGLPDHLTTTGQASGQANYYMVKQVAKTTSWSGVGGQASGPANFRRKILPVALLTQGDTPRTPRGQATLSNTKSKP